MPQEIFAPRGKITYKDGQAEIVWKKEFVNKINRELSEGGAVQKFIDSTILAGIAPYWARRTGAAIKSGILNTVIGSGLLRYATPYIRPIFYGETAKGTPIKYNQFYNRYAGPRPDLRYKAEKLAELKEAVRKKVREVLH